MSLIDDDDVVFTAGGEELFGVAYQPLVSGNGQRHVPGRTGNRFGAAVAVVAAVGVDDWGVDGELHQQLALPLFSCRFGGNDQYFTRSALVETGLEDDAGL